MRKQSILTIALGIFCTFWPVFGQDQQQQQPTAEELEKQKAERDKNAYRLLDQVIDEAQSLRLTENRVRIQISAADVLWDHNQARARSLFALASEGLTEMMRTTPTTSNQRGLPNQERRSLQLRQELVLAAARHDAALAYQLLAATKPATPIQTAVVDPRLRQPQSSVEDNLEQMLLGRIAALDPKLAAQNAELMIEKGQFPRSLTEVINQLQRQDPEAAEKLADKTVKRIQSANILTNSEAANLAQALLMPGPRPAESASSASETDRKTTQPSGRTPVLQQSVYVDLLSSVIDSALKATPQTQQNNPRAQANQRQRGQGLAVGMAGPRIPGQSTARPQPTEAQIEQNNARRLMTGLQVALPMIDQYLPAKAPLVRQKMAELGIADNLRLNVGQTLSALQGNPTAETIFQAAAAAPPQLQPRLYQQAALKAADEGNVDRARQIATDHLQANVRDSVMKRIDFREITKKAEGTRIEEIRQNLGRLQSDNERVDLLLQLARNVQKSNPKLMNQLLDEARQMTNRRATNYDHFEQQLKVARAFSTVDPSRSFEVLDPGISQLNELLSAAAVLSGFEMSMFRDGEMALQGGNGLTAAVNRFGQELAVLARSDFERSETLAGRFQFPEPRIMARLAIVQGLLGVPASPGQPNVNFFRDLGQNFSIRPQ